MLIRPVFLLVALAACTPAKWQGAAAHWYAEAKPIAGRYQLEVNIFGRATNPIKQTCLAVDRASRAEMCGVPLEVVAQGGGGGYTYLSGGSEATEVPDADCASGPCCKPVRLKGRTAALPPKTCTMNFEEHGRVVSLPVERLPAD